MEKEGSKTVEIVGVDDKRQITAVFAGSLAGDFLLSLFLQRHYELMSSNSPISCQMAYYT